MARFPCMGTFAMQASVYLLNLSTCIMWQLHVSWQGCWLTSAWVPGAPKLCVQATKVFFKEPERVPKHGIFIPIQSVQWLHLDTLNEFLCFNIQVINQQKEHFIAILFTYEGLMFKLSYEFSRLSLIYKNSGRSREGAQDPCPIFVVKKQRCGQYNGNTV